MSSNGKLLFKQMQQKINLIALNEDTYLSNIFADKPMATVNYCTTLAL